MNANESIVLRRQAPLRAAYRQDPEQAVICKYVRTVCPDGGDPLHGTVVPGKAYGVSWHYGNDRAVGGLHDAPNPGEMLCAALAACQDATVRMVADLMGVVLTQVEVEVTGKVDVRGSLMVDRSVPVAFRSMKCKVHVQAAPGTPPGAVEKVLAQAERSCINLATLRAGVPVSVAFDGMEGAPAVQSG